MTVAAALGALPPLSEERLADLNRLVVRNTFLECGDREDCDSDTLETGDFARASTEPVPQRGDTGGPLDNGSLGISRGLKCAQPGQAGCSAPGQQPSLPEEEPLYVFSRQRPEEEFFFSCPPSKLPGPAVGASPGARSPAVACAPNCAGPLPALLPPGLPAGLPTGLPSLPAGLPAGWPQPTVPPAGLDMVLSRPPPSGLSRPPTVTANLGQLQEGNLAAAVPWCAEALDVSRAAQAAAAHGPVVAQQAALIAIRDMVCSVTLADPGLPDCPLIGCSDGFEALTGYSRAEIIGQNCRFMNRGLCMQGSLRAKLRDATNHGTEFIGVVPNMRKNGKRFQNLLHMTTLTVKDKRYIVGIQADASHIRIDPRNSGHLEALQAAAERIFAGNIDAWIQMQAREFSIRLPVPYSQLLKLGAPTRFAQEMGNLVKLGCAPSLQEAARAGDDGEVPCGKPNLEHIDEMDGRSTTAGTLPNPIVLSGADGRVHGAREMSRAEAQRVEVGSTPPEPPQPANASGLKSTGSIGHPDDCVECCFHFFGPSGCRAAADCEFCHEFHPRKNAKKNRRLIKRLANAPIAEQSPAVSAVTSEPTPTRAAAVTDAALALRAPKPALRIEACSDIPSVAGEPDSASMPEDRSSVAPAAPEPMPAPVCQEMVQLSYVQRQPHRPEKVVLVSGMRTWLPPNLRFSTPESQESLAGCLIFVVEPPLPAGLSLHAKEGDITGVPTSACGPSEHVVTVKTLALGHGGITLGEMPLTRCFLELCVIDMANLTLCSTREDGAGPAGQRLVLTCSLKPAAA